MWFLLMTVFLGVAEAGQGRNFMIALEDRDERLAEDPPSLWVIPLDGVSVEYPLSDLGESGDALAGDHSYSAVVDDLPDSKVLLVLQNSTEELWRQVDFLVPAEMDYPALRLQAENGLVKGGLQDDPSPEERREQESAVVGPDGQLLEMQQGSWQHKMLLGLFFLVVAAVFVWAVVFAIRVYRVRQVRRDWPQQWSLSSELPAFEPGIQVWTSSTSPEDLRARIASMDHSLGSIFWVPGKGMPFVHQPGIRSWKGEAPSLGEALHWRGGSIDPLLPGPIFVVGPDSFYRASESWGSWIQDLQEMVDCPLILLVTDPEARSQWQRVDQAEAWLRERGPDEPPV